MYSFLMIYKNKQIFYKYSVIIIAGGYIYGKR